jgi:hypothetical protein
MTSTVQVIREIGESEPHVRAADLISVVSWIEANWSTSETEYEFLAAQRRNASRKAGGFDTEARSSRWMDLRFFCKKECFVNGFKITVDNYDGYKRVDPNVEADIKHIQKAVSDGCLAYVGDPLTPESIAALRDEVEEMAWKILEDVRKSCLGDNFNIEVEHDVITETLHFRVSAKNVYGQALIQRMLGSVDKM